MARLDGEAIYTKRLRTRASWYSIGSHFGCQPKSAVRSARRYANKEGKLWPIKILTSSEIAYQERAEGLSWEEIGESLNLSKDSSRRSPHRYAQKAGSPWPPGDPNGRIIPKQNKGSGTNPLTRLAPDVYEYRRKTGLTWREIAEHFGLTHTHCYGMAKDYAKRHELPFGRIR